MSRSRSRDRSRGHGGGASQFTPLSLPSLAGWWRVSADSVTIATGVSQWNDLSGNARHLTQATGGTQPAYTALGIGGLPSLTFVATKYLDCVAATWGVATPQPNTVYIVGHTTQDTQRDFLDNVTGAGDRQIFGTTTSPSPQPFVYAGASLLAPTQALTSATVMGYIANGNSTAIYLADSQTAKVTGAGGALGMGSLRVGASQGATTPLVGQVSEIIVYAASHDATTRRRVFQYLGSRYGLAVV